MSPCTLGCRRRKNATVTIPQLNTSYYILLSPPSPTHPLSHTSCAVSLAVLPALLAASEALLAASVAVLTTLSLAEVRASAAWLARFLAVCIAVCEGLSDVRTSTGTKSVGSVAVWACESVRVERGGGEVRGKKEVGEEGEEGGGRRGGGGWKTAAAAAAW